ncbi:MAG: Endo-1,4-beta-xylanase A precursor [Pelotomaculum sp. PtaB.Bin013]|uniref:S-layer homology domain-containing protein n=1 Tax=Pelotomaculum isophthalicicum JI TaxID=947010 RepID=A0A9X4JWL7_9FIRM|nr:S-layer homology domain-containing protein [Pelotomaculum isophthalicicum]MDF9409403.1 S-layer homology domain-containing protein [Pelotomaculum isophthalicicum JI]OPX91755.1 MAG: Endo-1,4-beta-xylanase A precursor [Pelotomaculum sp. PtaB.Bin013]
MQRKRKLSIILILTLTASLLLPMATPASAFTIQYFGHSQVLMTTDAGTKILMDPPHLGDFGNLGVDPGPIYPNVVTVSHQHSDHNNSTAAWVYGRPLVLNGISPLFDSYNTFNSINQVVNDTVINDVYLPHFYGAGDDAAFVFNVDGLRIVHLGDGTGSDNNRFTAAEKQALGTPDILFVPIGGPMGPVPPEYGGPQMENLSTQDVVYAIQDLQPKVVIPIHWWSQAGLNYFLTDQKSVGGFTYSVKNSNSINVESNNLPTTTQIWVMPIGAAQAGGGGLPPDGDVPSVSGSVYANGEALNDITANLTYDSNSRLANLKLRRNGNDDISGGSYDSNTEFTVTINNNGHTPYILLGAGYVQSWETGQDGVTTIRVKGMSFKFPDGTPVHLGVQMAIAYDANQAPYNMPVSYRGMSISTNASSFNAPVMVSGTQLYVYINGVSGEEGYFKVFLPEALLQDWGITSNNQLAAQIGDGNGNNKEAVTNAIVTDVAGGKTMEFSGFHYSDHRVFIGKAEAGAPVVTSAATNNAGNKIILTFNKAMADPAGKHAQFTVTVGGTPDAVTAAALNADPQKIELTLANPIYHGDVITIGYTAGTVVAADGGVLATFAGQAVTNNGPVKVTSPTVSVDSNNKNLSITSTTPATTLAIPNNVTDATINVVGLLNAPVAGKVTTSALPNITIQANTSVNANPVQVAIPAGTTVTADAADNWDGTINVPTVKPNNSVAVTADAGKTATVNTVIEVGFGDVPLTFSKAVRILIPGQAGKDAGYYRGGAFNKITAVLSSDTQAAGDALPAGGDGKIDVGSDLVIWTKHFTKFVTYTQTSAGGGGGGGGGVPPVSSSTTVTATSGGTVTSNDATIVVPAGAVTGDIKVTVEKVANTASLSFAKNTRLISDVFEITKDKAGDFSKAVTITLPFDKSKLDTAKYDIGIFWLNPETGKWTKLDNIKIDLASGKVSGDVNHFTKFAVLAVEKGSEAPTVAFSDIAGHWAQNEIEGLVARGAVTGYPDGTFKPDNTITRAEFATVLVKALKLAPQNGKIFADTARHWARDYIATAASNGIVNGYDNETFGPDDLITREQMAVMIVKAEKLAIVSEGISFEDGNKISAWARSAVATAAKKGIMKGYPDNTFKPEGNSTRAEAVTAIMNALK